MSIRRWFSRLSTRQWVWLFGTVAVMLIVVGYGVVMNPVDQVTPQGRPVFYLKDLPPQSTVSLEVNRPEIYYGEMMDDVVFVGSGLEEFDYP